METLNINNHKTKRNTITLMLAALMTTFVMVFTQGTAHAVNTVPLGNLARVSIFANVDLDTNGNNTISGDVAVNASTSLLGINLPIGLNLGGILNIGNSVSAGAKLDCDAALNSARSRTITANLSGSLNGRVLLPGVYSGSGLNLNGVLTLDAKGDPNAVFILNVNGNVNIGANAVIKLLNGANSGRVFITSNANVAIGAGAKLVGRVLAVGNIVVGNNAVVAGALLSCGASVEINTDIVNTNPIVGATVDVEIPPTTGTTGTTAVTIPINEPEDVTPTTTGDSSTPTSSANGQVLGEDVMQALTSSGNTARTGSSGLLAYTGRNALVIFAIGSALAGVGWAVAVTFKRRQFEKSHPEL